MGASNEVTTTGMVDGTSDITMHPLLDVLTACCCCQGALNSCDTPPEEAAKAEGDSWHCLAADCCHSGTLLDFPNVQLPNGDARQAYNYSQASIGRAMEVGFVPRKWVDLCRFYFAACYWPARRTTTRWPRSHLGGGSLVVRQEKTTCKGIHRSLLLSIEIAVSRCCSRVVNPCSCQGVSLGAATSDMILHLHHSRLWALGGAEERLPYQDLADMLGQTSFRFLCEVGNLSRLQAAGVQRAQYPTHSSPRAC